MNPDLNKIIESFNKLNDQARYAVLGGLVFLIFLLDVFLLAVPQISSIISESGQINKISADTQEVISDKQRINVLRKNLQLTRHQWSALSDRVRPIQEVPIILGAISSIANEYDVKIDQLMPEKQQQEVLKSASDGKYYALPVEVKARCGYHMFGRFLNKLENENLYFIIKDFIIQNDDTDSSSRLFTLTIKLILVDRGQIQPKSL